MLGVEERDRMLIGEKQKTDLSHLPRILLRVFLSLVLVCSGFNMSAAYAGDTEEQLDTASVESTDQSTTQDTSETSGDTASTSADATSDEQEVLEESEESEESETVDITQLWSEGSLSIKKGGTYVLSEDIETSGTLYVNVPAGEEAVIDFQGHSVAITGVLSAGIDVSGSEGTVRIIDSTYEAGEPQASLSLDVRAASSSVAGISLYLSTDKNAPVLEVCDIAITVDLNTLDMEAEEQTYSAYGIYIGMADREDAGELPETCVLIDNCLITARVNTLGLSEEAANELANDYGERALEVEDAGWAIGVYAGAPGVSLDGNLEILTESAGYKADLYASYEAAFVVGEDLSATQVISLVLEEASDGSVFAELSENANLDTQDLALLFCDESASWDIRLVNRQVKLFAASDETTQTQNAEENVSGGVQLLSGQETLATDTRELYDSSNIEGAINLNEYWEDTSVALTLNTGGVYYLTGDITTSMSLTLQATASSGDITLYLNGYTLTSTRANGLALASSYLANATALYINAAGGTTITVEGADKTGNYIGTVKKARSGEISTYDSAIGVYGTGSSTVMLRNLNAQNIAGEVDAGNGVGISASNASITLNIENCQVTSDFSQASCTSASSYAAYGIYLSGGTQSVTTSNTTISNTTINVTQSTNSASAGTVAYGIWCNNYMYNLSILDTSVTATASQGSAYGIRGTYNYSLSSGNANTGVNVTVSARDAAYGLYTGAGGGTLSNGAANSVLLGGPLSVQTNVTSESGIAVDLASGSYTTSLTNAPFIINGSFSSTSSLSVLLGSDSDANENNSVIAAFADGFSPSEEQKATLLALFENALGASDMCEPVLLDGGIGFATKSGSETSAIAIVKYSNDERSYFKGISAALSDAAANDGSTLILNSDITSSISLVSGISDGSMTIDLNGHDIAGITNASYAGTVTLTDSSSGEKGQINGSVSNSNSSANLIIDGVSIFFESSSTSQNPISVSAGTLTLCNDSETAEEERASALISLTGTAAGTSRGAYASSSGTLVFENYDLKVEALLASSGTVYLVGAIGTSSFKASSSTFEINVPAGAYCYGITIGAAFTAANGYLDDCTVKVFNDSSYEAQGLRLFASGAIEVSDTTVEVQNTSGSATAVYLSSDTSGSTTVVFTDISLSCDAASDSLLFNRASTDKHNVQFGGTFSFEGSDELVLGGVMSFQSDFEFEDEAALLQIVNYYTLDNHVFAKGVATGLETDAPDISSLVSHFEAGEGSVYEGFTAQVLNAGSPTADNTQLEWYHDDVAVNTSTNAYYRTLSDALDDLSDDPDETIQLLDDIVVNATTSTITSPANAALLITKSGTLDLNGHTLRIDTSTTSTAVTSSLNQFGLAFQPGTTSGTTTTLDFTITDSKPDGVEGVLEVLMEGAGRLMGVSVLSPATSSTATSPQTKLTLDGAKISVTQVTSDDLASAAQGNSSVLYGVYVGKATTSVTTSSSSGTGSAFIMVNGAEVEVISQAEDSEYGAERVVGVAQASQRSYIEIDETSSVVVEHTTEMTWNDGEVDDVDETPYLGKVTYDESSSTYQAILQAFIEQAQWDEQSQRYYALPLWLDDGRTFYVVSEPTSDGGNGEEIAISEIWTQRGYSELGVACGVQFYVYTNSTSVTDRSVPDSVIKGTIQVSGENADNYGIWADLTALTGLTTTTGTSLDLLKTSNVVLDGANISVGSGSTGASTNMGETDFADYYGLGDTVGSVPFYLIETHNGAAYGYYSRQASTEITSGDDVSRALLTLIGDVTINAVGDNAADIVSYTSFALDQSTIDALQEDERNFSVLDPGNGVGTEGNISGKVFAKGAAGTTLSSDAAAQFVDAEGNLIALLTTDEASSLPVLAWGEGNYTVSFRSGDEILLSETVSFGQTISLPSSDDSRYNGVKEDGYVYEFLGWSLDSTCTAEEFGEAATDIPAGTTTYYVVTSSVTYYAIYQAIPRDVTVTFTGMVDSDGTAIDDVVFDTTINYSLGAALGLSGNTDVIYKPQDYSTSTATMRFVGWRDPSGTVWSSDYGIGTIIFLTDYLNYADIGITFTAVYVEVGANQHLVTVYSDYYIVAARFAVDNGTSPVIPNTGTSSGYERNSRFTSDDEESEWVGVNLGRLISSECSDSSTVDYSVATDGSGNKVSPTDLPASSVDQEFTLMFTMSKLQGYITLNYYVPNDSGSANLTTWSGNNYGSTYLLDYGTDPIDQANSIISANGGDLFIADNCLWEFVGYSVRPNDSVPISGWEKDGSLPLIGTAGIDESRYDTGPGTTYHYTVYAIYKKTSITASVSFYVSGESEAYAVAEDVAATTTIDQAFAATGVDAPSQTGKRFVGWSTDEDASGTGLSPTIIDLAQEAFSSGEAQGPNFSFNVYAVFEDLPTCSVVFVNGAITGEDNTYTISGITNGTSLGSALDELGLSLPSALMNGGSGTYFKGFVLQNADGTETPFSLEDTLITEDMYVYASFGTIETAFDSSLGIQIDLSEMVISSDIAESAKSVEVRVETVNVGDGNLLFASGYSDASEVQFYQVLVVALYEDESEEVIESGFGTINLSLPANSTDEYDVSVFGLTCDGSASTLYTGASTDGVVSFSVNEGVYSIFGGNYAVGLVPNSATAILEANRANCIERLEEAFASYRQADYSSENWAILVSYYENALSAINSSSSASEMVSLTNQAITQQMPSVSTIASEANASSTESVSVGGSSSTGAALGSPSGVSTSDSSTEDALESLDGNSAGSGSTNLSTGENSDSSSSDSSINATFDDDDEQGGVSWLLSNWWILIVLAVLLCLISAVAGWLLGAFFSRRKDSSENQDKTGGTTAGPNSPVLEV